MGLEGEELLARRSLAQIFTVWLVARPTPGRWPSGCTPRS